jgi:hypothetical protein
MCVLSLEQTTVSSDTIEWATGLRGRLNQIHNPAVRTYGGARLAELVCGVSKEAGSELFRQAVMDLRNLPTNAFDDSVRLLEAPSFTALWKLIVPAAGRCDPETIWNSDLLNSRKTKERPRANGWLTQSMAATNPDRAAQLIAAALSVTDPGDTSQHKAFLVQLRIKLPILDGPPANLDLGLLSRALIKLAANAPDLADQLFEEAVKSVIAPPTGPGELAELAPYLFLAPADVDNPEPNDARALVRLGGSSFLNLMATRATAQPDAIAAYLNAAMRLFTDTVSQKADPLGAYALAYQMLPKAVEFAPDLAGVIQATVSNLEAQLGGAAAGVRDAVGVAPTAATLESGPRREFWLVGRVRSELAAGHFAAARAVAENLNNPSVHRQVRSLIDVEEVSQSLKGKDAEWALSRTSALPPGVKRSLLYAADAAAATDPTSALQALHMGLKDAESFPPPPRACALAALATASLPVDRDEAMTILNRLVVAQNDVGASSEREGFDPKAESFNDNPFIRCGVRGVYEVVDTRNGQQRFPLRLPKVSVYTLNDFIKQDSPLEFQRLEAAVLNLRDDLYLSRGLLALVELRLKKPQ